MITTGYQEPHRFFGSLLGTFSLAQLVVQAGILLGGFRCNQFTLFRTNVSRKLSPIRFWLVVLLLTSMLVVFSAALWFGYYLLHGHEIE